MPVPAVGEITGTDMREDKNAYDESKLLDSISKNLSDVEGLEVDDVDDSTPVETDDTPADDSDTTPPMPTAKKAAVEDDPTPEDADDTPADDATDDKTKPAIPDNHYRAAVHQGWKPEDIKELYDSNPELALKTLKKLHEDTNKVSQVFAQKGRLAAQKQAQPQNQQQPPQVPPVQSQPVDMEKLKERYEDDPFGAMAELIKATVGQKSQPQQQQQVVQPTQTQDENARFAEYVANQKAVSEFFNDDDMTEYNGIYGAEKDGLLPGHEANRQAVLETADAIIDGMKLEGRDISVSDALMRAHLIVSAPVTEQVVRNKLVKSAKKREKGMTLRPSKSSSPAPKNIKGQKSEEQRTSDAQARLNAMSL